MVFILGVNLISWHKMQIVARAGRTKIDGAAR